MKLRENILTFDTKKIWEQFLTHKAVNLLLFFCSSSFLPIWDPGLASVAPIPCHLTYQGTIIIGGRNQLLVGIIIGLKFCRLCVSLLHIIPLPITLKSYQLIPTTNCTIANYLDILWLKTLDIKFFFVPEKILFVFPLNVKSYIFIIFYVV